MSNDPYSTPTRYREADLKAWTAEIERARREYRLNPFHDRRLGDKPERRRLAGDGCFVTIWAARLKIRHTWPGRDPMVIVERRCSQPVASNGRCARHEADRERLS